MLSDAELVRAAQAGDATCLGTLLERYRAPLYGRALQIFGHGEQAQDAVQETFLVALRKMDQVRKPAAVGGWLHAILRNVCYMKLREERGEILFDEPPGALEDTLSESCVEESIDRLALRDWVWTALGELPEALQVTAVLRYFGSHASYEEISALLGVPMGTVKSRLNQAKAKLADALFETAGMGHDETRQLADSRARFFEAAYEEHNQKQSYDLLLSAFSEDLVVSISDGSFFPRGYEFLIEDAESDLGAGRKPYPMEVISSKDVTIIECEVENSPEEPFHCPPSFSQVGVYRGDRIQRMYWYLAPRPESCWGVTLPERPACEVGRGAMIEQTG